MRAKGKVKGKGQMEAYKVVRTLIVVLVFTLLVSPASKQKSKPALYSEAWCKARIEKDHRFRGTRKDVCCCFGCCVVGSGCEEYDCSYREAKPTMKKKSTALTATRKGAL